MCHSFFDVLHLYCTSIPQNPYETFIGMCIASDNPQDTFKQIWSESFKVR